MIKNFYWYIIIFFIISFKNVAQQSTLAQVITLTSDEQELYEQNSFQDLFSLGRSFKIDGNAQQALRYLKPAIIHNPQDGAANWELGDVYLLLGDYVKGFLGFKWRWIHDPRYQKKLWTGQDLDNKTILVYCQWGLGDTFMYVRYLKLLKNLGATVLCACQKPLKNLLLLCPYIDSCITDLSQLPYFDFQAPISYLPEVFNTTVDTIYNEIPYLYAEKNLIEYWKNYFETDKNFKIGICWQGSNHNDTQMKLRPIQLKMLTPLFMIPNVKIFSLQQIDGLEQIPTLPPQCILHQFDKNFDTTHGSFMDTAAVLKNLDLVITIDTSIAHLAGALGTPVWVMLSYANEWRFLTDRSDSPWYPTIMKIFRQSKKRDWNEVIENIIVTLQKKLKNKGL